MSRTYRTARGLEFSNPDASIRAVKERNQRPWAKAWRRALHRRDRHVTTRQLSHFTLEAA